MGGRTTIPVARDAVARRAGRLAGLQKVMCRTAVLGGVVLALFVVLWPGGGELPMLADLTAFPLVGFAAAGAAAVRSLRGGARVSWALIAASLVLATVGHLVDDLAAWGLLDRMPARGAQGAHRFAYPPAYFGIIGLLRTRMTRWELSYVIDSLAGASLMGAIAWAFIVPSLLAAQGWEHAFVVYGWAWPVLDVIICVVLLCGALGVATGFDRRLVLTVGGLTLCAVGDCIAAVGHGLGNGIDRPFLHLPWALGFVLMAAAACQDADTVNDHAGTVDTEPWTFILLPMAMGAIGCTLLSPAFEGRISAGPGWLVFVTLCLAMVRVSLTYRELWSLKETRRQAHTDELTGLKNRRAFLLEADSLLATSGPSTQTALVMLDLNGFKEVNDSLGHSAGDTLLVELSRRLEHALPLGDVVLARLGGDEFALLLSGVGTGEALDLVDALQRDLSRPIEVEGSRVDVRGSFGIAVAPEHGTDLAGLMRRADIAMYRAKRARVDAVVYDPADNDDHGEGRLQRISELRGGLERREFVVHYQPQVDLRSGTVLGAEALVRWQHPTEGLLYPDRFLGLMQDSGLMPGLTEYVLDVAVAQAAAWAAQGRSWSVAVNLPASAVTDLDLPARIYATLRKHGLPPELLVIEITEETLLSDRARAAGVLTTLHESGVLISVDDFGSGYSSLAYLRELPVDELKLDRSFVQPITQDPRAASIVRTAIDLAHALDMRVVAEGVEDELTAVQLAGYGCDFAQGYHYARPRSAESLEGWFAELGTGVASASTFDI